MNFLSNKQGFLGIDNKFNIKEKAIVIPFGLEKTVSYGGGTKNGPREIIKASLVNRGIFILAEDIEKAAVASNIIAPEHLEISVDAPEAVLSYIENAGAIFLGRYTAESLGDYCAGPSHVLPTSGTAKFSSVLGVYDFQKRSSVINCSPAGAKKLAITAAELARNENLEAHALSAEYRLEETFNSDKP